MEINVLPRWLLAKLRISSGAQPHWALFLSSLLALFAPFLLIHIPHICLFRKLLGIPCPGCGILHGMASLLQMHIAAAWVSNPAAFFLAAFLVFQLIARPVALAFEVTRSAIGEISYHGDRVVGAALLLVWINRLIIGGIHAFRHMS